MRIWFFLVVGALAGCHAGLGDACSEAKDCDRVRGGYCAVTGICAATCSRAGDTCSEIGLCVTVTSSRTVCLPSCMADEECRPGDACLDVDGGRACVLSDPFFNPE